MNIESIKVDHSCSTCEFNFNGKCVGRDDKYGELIKDVSITCNSWGINLEYFNDLTKSAPWYISTKYNNCKISFEEFLVLMDKFYSKEPIEINIYDIIEKIYSITTEELANILGVSTGVIGYARYNGTIPRRAAEFSKKLNIPIEYFTKVTNLDIDNIRILLLKNCIKT